MDNGDRRLLVLWDIDHTLLEAGSVNRELYAEAFVEVLGRPLERLVDMAGRTDRAIIADVLRLNGVSEDQPTVDAFYRALAGAAHRLVGRMRQTGRAYAGAREALAALASDGVVQTVVTGNIPSIALAKLSAFDLTEHLDLDVGGYGDDGRERPELIRAALRRVRDRRGLVFAPESVVVLGDTAHDIRGAHAVGARAVGVAMGPSSVAELTAFGADAVLADLASLDAVYAAVFGTPDLLQTGDGAVAST